MGQFEDKIKEHFWMLVCSSIGDIGDEEAFKGKYEQVFKINSKEAYKIAEDHVWTVLHSIISKTKDPNELRNKLEPVLQIDTKKTKDHIWEILTFTFGDNRNQEVFRTKFEPILKINSKEALKLVEDKVWTIIYSITRKINDPLELSRKLEQVVQIDVKPAAEMIKENNPEKYELLLIYK